MPEFKNKLKSKLFIIFLAAAFVFAAPSVTLAAESGAAWEVEDFGVFQTPAGWQTVKLEQVLDRLDKMFKELPVTTTKTDASATVDPEKVRADFTNAKNLLNKILKEQNIKIYQAALDNNTAYYVAGLIFFKEDKPMTENETFYFAEKTTKKDRKNYAALMMAVQNEVINSTQILSGTNLAFDMNFKILPAGQVEHLTVKNAPAYGIGNRIIVNAFGITAPYYVKTYIFNLEGHIAYAVLWSLDSERAFWDKAFRPIISSLQ